MEEALRILSAERFDVVVFCAPSGLDTIRRGIRRNDATFVLLPDRFTQAAERVRSARCHALYYRSIGSDPLSYFLPFARLAAIQVTAWGTHVTSGIPAVDYYLVAVGEDEAALVRRLATRLRAAGHSVLYALRGAGVKAQFKDANARGARRVVVVGPDEVAAGVVAVRDMGAGEEEKVRIEDL